MELFFLSSLIIGVLFLFLVSLFLLQEKHPNGMPPGKMGWPVVGETLEFLANGRKGLPYKFIFDRLSKYAPSSVFKTSILGEKVIVMCGASSHKFLYSNESKLVQGWWPKSITKIFPSAITALDDSKKLRKFLPTYLKPEALQRYIPVMDTVAIRYMEANWEGKDKVVTYPLSKHYTFLIACRLFLSVEDPAHVATFEEPHNTITAGMIAMPIELPGTRFYRAIKASRHIKELFKAVIKQRILDLADGKATPTQDILSHMLKTPAPDGEFMNEFDIANKILGLIIGGHTASTTITFIIYYLSKLPHIYDRVYHEQMEIAKSKKPGELLNWDDVQKMKYSWNVACEAMRLTPPVQGSFREAITDFTYNGFHIPKGWKLYWSGHSTGRDPEVFPEPEKFDPTRFEGTGPAPYTFVPFGGGPRMCPGNEYARLEILVFMHNLVKRFKWERDNPNERVVVSPMPQPEHGLPIRLIPHPKTAVA